ncbi:hypothetical protein ACX1C1_01645 [Paenibacillus sp. strain BS8-2]
MNGNAAKEKRSPARNVAYHLWKAYRHVLIWFWLVFTVIFVGINELIMRGYIPDEEFKEAGSIWSGASLSPRIFLLVLGILLTLGSLSSFVSNGVTRRAFARGGLLFIAGMSLICSLVVLIGYPIERMIIEISGAERILVHPNLLVEVLKNILLFFSYFCAGWMIGTGFYRFHWFKGLILCHLLVGVIILLEIVPSLEWVNSASGNHAINFVLLLLSCVCLAWINVRLLHRVVIRRKLTI